MNQRRSFPAGSGIFGLAEYRGKSEGINYIIMKLSAIQRDILVGTILGDAFLQKTGKKNARLRLEHGIDQKDYLLWKVKNLQQLFQGKPKYLKRAHPISGETYEYLRHQSQSMPELGKWRNVFYPEGKKIIPENIEELIRSPRTLAVWYMDDGCYYRRDRVSYLYLGNAARREAELASRALRNRFSLSAKVLAKKKGFALYFSPSETRKLALLIEKFVIRLLSHKLPS